MMHDEPEKQTEGGMKNTKGEQELGKLAGTLRQLSREGYEVMPDYFVKSFVWKASAEEPSDQQVGLQRAGSDCEGKINLFYLNPIKTFQFGDEEGMIWEAMQTARTSREKSVVPVSNPYLDKMPFLEESPLPRYLAQPQAWCPLLLAKQGKDDTKPGAYGMTIRYSFCWSRCCPSTTNSLRCLERTKRPRSKRSDVNGDSLIADGYITTPLSQKKLQKNITQKSPGPRITWKGKGIRRKMRELGAWKKKVGNARCGQAKQGGNTFQEELPTGQRKHNYIKKCILHNLARKRDKRLKRDMEEKEKEEIRMREDMARKMARVCFPTLDLDAKVGKISLS